MEESDLRGQLNKGAKIMAGWGQLIPVPLIT